MTKRKRTFADIDAARSRYNPAVEGYGSPAEWRRSMNARMGWEEASRVKAEAQASGRWKSEYDIIGEMAGAPLNEGSMWSEIKSAFRKAAMNCHPDRTAQHGKSRPVAEEQFKRVNAAYALLAGKYGEA